MYFRETSFQAFWQLQKLIKYIPTVYNLENDIYSFTQLLGNGLDY